MGYKDLKIGILTFHKSVNYGSVLQAWALQETLKSFGHEVEVIDYEPESYKKAYGLFLPGTGMKVLKKNIARLPIAGDRKRQIRFFKEFRDNELNLSREQYGPRSDAKELEGRYDLIVCGSDQIWNVHAKDSDDFFFLPDVDIRKIAYAVSVNNTDYTEERCDERMKKAIGDFDFLSFREATGTERVKAFLGEERNIHTVLDPTLLHEGSDYDRITSRRLILEDYVFLYKVWVGNDSFNMAKALGDSLGLPVYTMLLVKDKKALCRIEEKGIRVIRKDTRPGDYLSLIKNASYVMTDSFHGTAFSIIFERPFVCVREKRANGTEKNDERILGLLGLADLKERYIRPSEMGDFDITGPVDYGKVSSLRMTRAGMDIALLKKAVEETDQ